MKQSSILFLQGVIALTGIVALSIMIRFPLIEGRAEKLDLFSIYSDPFILYSYVASVPFFIALYKTIKLLGLFGKNEAFSLHSMKTSSSIKYCVILLSILIVMAGLYIRIFHNKDDDPAGFLAMCIVATFVTLVVATAISVFEKILQKGMDLKVENERLNELSKK